MLLSTRYLKTKGIPGKLQQKYVGPFQITSVIGQQAYRVSLLENWKIHFMFHMSILKDWKTASLYEDQHVLTNDVPEGEEPYYEIERILRWGTQKRGSRILKEYLFRWIGYHIKEASWVLAKRFSHPN